MVILPGVSDPVDINPQLQIISIFMGVIGVALPALIAIVAFAYVRRLNERSRTLPPMWMSCGDVCSTLNQRRRRNVPSPTCTAEHGSGSSDGCGLLPPGPCWVFFWHTMRMAEFSFGSIRKPPHPPLDEVFLTAMIDSSKRPSNLSSAKAPGTPRLLDTRRTGRSERRGESAG